MINKKILLFLCGFNLLNSIQAYNDEYKASEMEPTMQEMEEVQNEETLLRFILLNRVDNLAQAFDKHHKFNHLYCNLLRKFLGINYSSLNEDSTLRLEKIMEGLSILQMKASDDIKYLFDMNIKTLLSFDCEILEKISEGQVNNFISLAFFVSQLIPTNFSEEHEKFIEYSEDSNEWSKVLLNFNQSFAELGIDRDGELYDEFQKTIVDKLEKSHTFKMYRACSERIYDRFNGESCGQKTYEKTCYKKVEKTYNNLKSKIKHYKNKNINDNLDSFDEDFMKFYDNELLIKSSLLSLFNMDTLFNLMILGRLGNHCPENISTDTKEMIKKYSVFARFILDELMSLSKAGSINWKKYEDIILEEEDYEKIVFNLSFLNNFDEMMSPDLMNRYQKEIEDAINFNQEEQESKYNKISEIDMDEDYDDEEK